MGRTDQPVRGGTPTRRTRALEQLGGALARGKRDCRRKHPGERIGVGGGCALHDEDAEVGQAAQDRPQRHPRGSHLVAAGGAPRTQVNEPARPAHTLPEQLDSDRLESG